MVRFKNGFTISNKELEKKTLEELYSIHSDLITSYGHGGGTSQLEMLERYIDARIEQENEILFA